MRLDHAACQHAAAHEAPHHGQRGAVAIERKQQELTSTQPASTHGAAVGAAALAAVGKVGTCVPQYRQQRPLARQAAVHGGRRLLCSVAIMVRYRW